jgi:uncharacterized protein YndB with AHSA1/START domain
MSDAAARVSVSVAVPPHLLAFGWRNANFAPHETTSVEVRFTPSGRGTLVSVTHRGWSCLRPDHPARHGRQGAEFYRMIGLWWGDQMSALREHAHQHTHALAGEREHDSAR